MDETGYAVGGGLSTRSRVIVPAHLKVIFKVGADNREWVSVIEGISATGKWLKPYFIFKGKNTLRRFAPVMNKLYPMGWHYGFSDNGWTDGKHALEWIERLEAESRPEDTTQWRLLICDGHSSHAQGIFIVYCHKHKIIILYLPPHSSHYLQPLDVGVFTGAKRRYNTMIQKRAEKGKVALKKEHFLEMYAAIRALHLSEATILAGFANTGIWPTNLEILRPWFKDNPVTLANLPLQTLAPYSETSVTAEIAGHPSISQPAESFGKRAVAAAGPGLPQLTGDAIFMKATRESLVVNPRASYNAVFAQLRVEEDRVKRTLLLDALYRWAERQETEKHVFKFTANAIYDSTVESRKDAPSNSKAHFGKAVVMDEDAYEAILKREAEEAEEERRKAEEKEIKKRQRQQRNEAEEAAKALRKQEREVKAAQKAVDAAGKKAEIARKRAASRTSTATPTKRIYKPKWASQLTKEVIVDPRLMEIRAERGSVVDSQYPDPEDSQIA